MHAELLPISSTNANGFDRLDPSKVGFVSENNASPVEKISSSGIETYQIPLTMWARK